MTIDLTFGSIKNRIAVLFLGLATVLLAVAFLTLSWLNREASEDEVAQRLLAGELAVGRALRHAYQHLDLAATLVARHPALREATAREDPAQLLEALRGYAAPLAVDVFAVIRDGRIVATTANRLGAGTAPELDALAADLPGGGAPEKPATRLIALGEGRIALARVARLDDVLPGLRLAAGVELGEALARRLQAEALADVAFLRQGGDNSWTTLASTLPAGLTDALRIHAGRLFAGQPASAVDLAGARHAIRRVAIAPDLDEAVRVVLLRSIDSLHGPFRTLQYLLLGIISGLLLLWAVGSLALARHIAGPLKRLAELATRVRHGDYTGSATIAARDEIGQLARTLEDMQADIAKRENRIAQLAFHDPLTALPNRASFVQQLEAQLADPARGQRPLGILLMGLDRFQSVNDALGHKAGDELLGIVARRLRANLGEQRVIARTGGDEFGVLVEPGTATESRNVAERLLRVMEQPIAVGGQDVTLGASVGVALHPRHGADALALLRNADSAMRGAKNARTGIAIYDPGEAVRNERRLSLLGELRAAVARDQLALVFEPKLDLRGGARRSAEALVRWDHPQRGRISPSEFIPFAEQTGFISALTEWVLRRGAHHVAHWAATGTPVQVSLNASARDLKRRELPAFVRELVNALVIPADLLCIEITESSFMDNPSLVSDILWRLSEIGVKVAIDDYGTGFSSLAYIKRLPVSELKIDRSFVSGIVTQRDSRTIVQSTIELGHNLGITVTAEGVEDAACLDLLRTMGCDRAQGYFIARPLAADQVADWFAGHDEARAIAAAPAPRPPLSLVGAA